MKNKADHIQHYLASQQTHVTSKRDMEKSFLNNVEISMLAEMIHSIFN